ncbi:MAG: Helix-turn-helix domain [Verrucomicrobiota bacterium]|jgi:predicted DNA-binding transcriptional regulator AlpA
MTPADRLVCFKEAAEMLGRISVRTIRRMIAARRLPEPVYVGKKPMFVLSELQAVIEALKSQRRKLVV